MTVVCSFVRLCLALGGSIIISDEHILFKFYMNTYIEMYLDYIFFI